MPLEINAGLERMIASFNDGWTSGALRNDGRPPQEADAALREYWLDGYHAGRDEMGKLLAPQPSVQ
jgi:hypothetical protein